MKYSSVVLLLLFSTNVLSGAISSFSQTGVITEETGHSETILINNQSYRINHETNVHALVRPGELGPKLPAGELIGFNVEQNEAEELPYITDIWLLNRNQK